MTWHYDKIIALLLVLASYSCAHAVYYYEHYEESPFERAERRSLRQTCRRMGDAGFLMSCGSLFVQTLVEVNYRHRWFWRPHYRYSRRPFVLMWSLGAFIMALANLFEVCSD